MTPSPIDPPASTGRAESRGWCMLIVLAVCCWAAAARAAVTVSFSGGLIADNGISAWNGSYSNATMDSRPDILPFNGPGVGATRYTGNNPVNLLGSGNILATIYTRISGNGTAAVTAAGGTTGAFGTSYTNYNLQTFGSGSRLPIAGATGTLGSALSLPNGTTLTAGTQLYAEFYSYVMDYNEPAAYWYDSGTHLMHQIYENGVMDFYYRDAGGQYHPFASYQNAVLDFSINYQTGVGNSTLWSGTSVPVGNVVLPATMDMSGLVGSLNTGGVIPAQRDAAPYVGFFGNFGASFSASFDTANAFLAPEPGRALMLLAGFMSLVLRRTRRSTGRPGHSEIAARAKPWI